MHGTYIHSVFHSFIILFAYRFTFIVPHLFEEGATAAVANAHECINIVNKKNIFKWNPKRWHCKMSKKNLLLHRSSMHFENGTQYTIKIRTTTLFSIHWQATITTVLTAYKLYIVDDVKETGIGEPKIMIMIMIIEGALFGCVSIRIGAYALHAMCVHFNYTNDVTAIMHNSKLDTCFFFLLPELHLNDHADFQYLMKSEESLMAFDIVWFFDCISLEISISSHLRIESSVSNWWDGKRSEREIKRYGSVCTLSPTEGVDNDDDTQTDTHDALMAQSTVII